MISAFMDGCSYDEILAAGNEYCKTSKIQKKGVKVVKEDRVIADALDPREW